MVLFVRRACPPQSSASLPVLQGRVQSRGDEFTCSGQKSTSLTLNSNEGEEMGKGRGDEGHNYLAKMHLLHSGLLQSTV